LLPTLLGKPHVAIVNVTSRLGFMPSALVPTYCATKAALHSYTQSLRFQLRDTSVQVIEIIPPNVQTALQGERGYSPNAVPLDEYIAETMTLLQMQRQALLLVYRKLVIDHRESLGRLEDGHAATKLNWHVVVHDTQGSGLSAKVVAVGHEPRCRQTRRRLPSDGVTCLVR
jgi:short-subunit dehydrogenase involved in D-alanine esterification of teichoic acids